MAEVTDYRGIYRIEIYLRGKICSPQGQIGYKEVRDKEREDESRTPRFLSCSTGLMELPLHAVGEPGGESGL